MTLQNIALLIGLGSMFGQILEESGGAKKIAQTFIDKFGQGHSSWALGITGLVIGTTVFFEAGVVVLIPLAFSVASQTKKSTLYYGIALLAGLAAGLSLIHIWTSRPTITTATPWFRATWAAITS